MTMSDDRPSSSDPAHHTELLLFDYFKHVTTLSLVALGGVLTITQDVEQIGQRALLVVVVLISLGGGTALSGLDAITKARLKNLPLPASIKWYRLVSATAFALGLGAYLALFMDIFQ
jgi:hypothetical protein